MIPTILKHEAIRTRGPLAVILLGAVAFSGAASLLVLLDWPGLAQVGLFVGIATIMMLTPVVQFALAIDYWRSTYRTTGHLTHSLPVRGGTIYAAKALWAMCITFAALLLTSGLAAMLFAAHEAAAGRDANPFAALAGFLDSVAEFLPLSLVIAAVAVVVLLHFSWTLQLLFAASVGSEEPLNRYGAGGPVIVLALVYLATQVLSFVGLAAIRYGVGPVDGGIGIVPMDVFAPSGAADGMMPLGFIPGILLLAVFCVWRTARSWNRHVSLV